MIKSFKNMQYSAEFDNDKPKFRYNLKRVWDEDLPKATLIMLNPSIANELKNDHSVNRCLNFLIENGFGSLEVVNLFALIEIDSKKLKAKSENIGTHNDKYIKKACDGDVKIIISWGSDNEYKRRKKQVLKLLEDKKLYYFKDTTNRTIPVHVSRLSKNFKLEPYEPDFK